MIDDKEEAAAAADGGGDEQHGATGEVREHSDSISLVARNFHPVVPVGLQSSESLKSRLKKIKQPRLLVAPAPQGRDSAGGGRGIMADDGGGGSNGHDVGASSV